MTSLLAETGNFFLNSKQESNDPNKYQAIAFKGDQEFLARCKNLFLNYEVTSSKFTKLTEDSLYFFAPYNKVKEAFFKCFQWEVIQEKSEQIKYVKNIVESEEGFTIDIIWDEEQVKILAGVKLEKFLNEVVIHKNFLGEIYNRIDKSAPDEHYTHSNYPTD